MWGHNAVRRALESTLPSVTLLYGPESIGRNALAEHLCRHYRLRAADIYRIPKLTTEKSKDLHLFANTAPRGPFKLAIIHLDGKTYRPNDTANAAALNSLLKLLEEPPELMKFILISSKPTLATIESRAFIYHCGLLSADDIEQILIEKLNYREKVAKSLAKLSNGTVQSAIDAQYLDIAKNKVLTVIKSVANKDYDLLIETTKGYNADGKPSWGESEHDLLKKLLTEAYSEQWHLFSADEVYNLHKNKPTIVKMISNLSKVADSKPKLAVRAALTPIMTRN